MNSRDWVYPFPGRTLRLHRSVEDPEGAAATRVALDTLDLLRSVWEPLSAEAVIFALDGDDPLTASLVDVARPHRLLVSTAVPAGVRVFVVMADPVTTHVPDLSRSAIAHWLDEALRDVAPGAGQRGEWAQLSFYASRAWVGPPGWRSQEAELRLRYEHSTVVVPIERAPSGAWLSGPREPAPDQPPLHVKISHLEGLLTLDLTRNYGQWLEPTEPAALRYHEIILQLRALGWTGEAG